MDNTSYETGEKAYEKYWEGVFTMDKENILKTLMADDLKHLNNKELCKLFKFLSCFFCCLDHCEDGHKPEPKPEPGPCPCEFPCYRPYFPCEPDKNK